MICTKNIHNSIWKVKTDQYISVNNILIIQFCLAVEPTSEGCVRLCALWRRLCPVSIGRGRSRWRTWWGLYLDEWKSVSSNPCLNSSRLLNGVGRYPYRWALLTTAWRRLFSSALRNPHQAGLAYNSCAMHERWYSIYSKCGVWVSSRQWIWETEFSHLINITPENYAVFWQSNSCKAEATLLVVNIRHVP